MSNRAEVFQFLGCATLVICLVSCAGGTSPILSTQPSQGGPAAPGAGTFVKPRSNAMVSNGPAYGWYYIQNWAQPFDYYYLDGNRPCSHDNGCKVQLWQGPGADVQRWYLTSGNTPNTYGLLNGGGSLCLDGNLQGQGGNGTLVQLWACNARQIQDWTFESSYDLYIIHPALYPNDCLDGRLPGDENSLKVQLWTCNGNAIQLWALSSAPAP